MNPKGGEAEKQISYHWVEEENQNERNLALEDIFRYFEKCL